MGTLIVEHHCCFVTSSVLSGFALRLRKPLGHRG